MKFTEEKIIEVSETIPEATPQILESILRVATEGGQLIFSEGQGQTSIGGKTHYPDYLQLEITDAQVAMRLAQQLINACADSMSNGGVLRAPVTLVISGEAWLSE